MNWRMRNDLRGSFIASVGWLFADLLFVLTMIFLASGAFSFQPPPSSPCIEVSTQSLSFMGMQGQSNPAPQKVTLTNCGPAGDWSASSANNSSWFNTNPASGYLEANAKQIVMVAVALGNLSPNTYNDQITFTLRSSMVKVDVTFTVSAPTPTTAHLDKTPCDFTLYSLDYTGLLQNPPSASAIKDAVQKVKAQPCLQQHREQKAGLVEAFGGAIAPDGMVNPNNGAQIASRVNNFVLLTLGKQENFVFTQNTVYVAYHDLSTSYGTVELITYLLA